MMTRLNNEILINASIDKIWEALSVIDKLEIYDPSVKKSTAISKIKSGVGAKRKVDMLDDKNWFEEICTVSKTNKELVYQLSACSFPIKNLKHSYSFKQKGSQTSVSQIMEYQVKFGIFGKILDFLMIRKQSDN